MISNKARTIRVAAIQMESNNGPVEANLRHAMPFINRAVEKGAKLILLPSSCPRDIYLVGALGQRRTERRADRQVVQRELSSSKK
jgi:predicted amidohydrolase